MTSKTKKVAILQTNYIPWKGYFDLINLVDEFILYDEVQYTRRDWRNRNIIKTQAGPKWLTIPIDVKGKYTQSINEAVVANNLWTDKHWKLLIHAYSKAKCFKQYSKYFANLYEQCSRETYLSKINFIFINKICEILNITTKMTWSTDYVVVAADKTDRLVKLCQAAKATHYLSGPSAKAYIDDSLFTNAGIKLEYMGYSDYPVYSQLHGEFIHQVSILDLLYNQGENTPKFMKSF